MAELVRQESEETAALVRRELRLAQLELQEKGSAPAWASVSSAPAACWCSPGLRCSSPPRYSRSPWSFRPGPPLVVAGVLLGAAGVLALTGKKQVDQARPPAPEEAIASTRRDIDEVRQRGRR